MMESASGWVSRQWHEVQIAESGIKWYTKRITTRLLEVVPEEEVFCRTIPADAKSVHVLVPSHLSADDALQHLRQLADERRLTHRTWYIASILALGVTVPLMILPIVPALPAYWNVFRIWSNRRAWLGATHLAELLPPSAALAALPPCSRLRASDAGECCRVQAAWDASPAEARAVVVPCELFMCASDRAAHDALASAGGDAEERRFLQDAERAERVLDAPGLAEHAQKRLKAARTLRAQHAQL